MGQTDPVALLPSQQSLGENPAGCSGVGRAGHGNPDDPVNILAPLQTSQAARSVLSSPHEERSYKL